MPHFNGKNNMQSSAVSYETQSRPTITEREYRAFQHAYDFFNAELFGNSLPHVGER